MVAGAGGPEQSEIDYPSVPLAYELIPASYEMIAQRIEAVDQRVQSLLAFSVTLTVAVLLIFSPSRGDLWVAAPSFPVAMAAFGLLVVVGLIARARWHITVVSPKSCTRVGLIYLRTSSRYGRSIGLVSTSSRT